ncbi:MAG: GPW/gp25 family protein [candidate division WOR-3 bacterium]
MFTKKSKSNADFSLSMSKNPLTGDIITLNRYTAIKRSVVNLIKTNFHERFYKPDLGTDIYKKLFESYTVVLESQIKESIKDVLNKYEPRIKVKDIQLFFDDYENNLNIDLEYEILNNFETDRVSMVFVLPRER